MHKRVTKLLFQPIIHKTQQKLSSWKGKMLTMAGQTVLIKAVLSAIPGYQMQTMLLPYGVFKGFRKDQPHFSVEPYAGHKEDAPYLMRKD